MSEIIVLAVLGLIVVGPKELPELARTIGRLLNELKRTTDGFQSDFKEQLRIDRLNNISHSKSNREIVPHEEQPSLPHAHRQDHESQHEIYREEPEPVQMEFQNPEDESAHRHPDLQTDEHEDKDQKEMKKS